MSIKIFTIGKKLVLELKSWPNFNLFRPKKSQNRSKGGRDIELLTFGQISSSRWNVKERQGAPRSAKERQGAPRSAKERQGVPRNAKEHQGTPRNAKERQGTPRLKFQQWLKRRVLLT
jgi:hypothetical protein